MRTRSMLPCLGSLALFTAVSPAFSVPFSVPFFIERNTAVQPAQLEADFTLQRPAILETIYLKCSGGNPTGGLVSMDGGPAGLNGTTGVAGNANTGLVVGAPANVLLDVVFTTPQPGLNLFSANNLGWPVKSKYQIIVFLGSEDTACFGNAVFRSID